MVTVIKQNFLPLINNIKYIQENKKSNISENICTFIVDKKVTKTEIKLLIENLFQVQILKINTLLLPKKYKKVQNFFGQKPQNKKVIVTLKGTASISNLIS